MQAHRLTRARHAALASPRRHRACSRGAACALAALTRGAELAFCFARRPTQAKNAAEIHKAIKDGAHAFLRTEYRAITSFAVPFTVFIFFLLGSGDLFTCAHKAARRARACRLCRGVAFQCAE
jgi:hypothetical protein